MKIYVRKNKLLILAKQQNKRFVNNKL